MANPMYGQNKADNALNNLNSIFKVLKYKVTVDSTGIAAGNDLIADGIPAFFTPIWCSVKNTEASEALHATTAQMVVETSGDILCPDLNGLAAGASVASLVELSGINAANKGAYSTAKDIHPVTANIKAASSSVTLEIVILGIDATTAVHDALIGE
jgi:hypothetical protein